MSELSDLSLNDLEKRAQDVMRDRADIEAKFKAAQKAIQAEISLRLARARWEAIPEGERAILLRVAKGE